MIADPEKKTHNQLECPSCGYGEFVRMPAISFRCLLKGLCLSTMCDSVSGPDTSLGCNPFYCNRGPDGVDRISDPFLQPVGSGHLRDPDWRQHCFRRNSNRLVWSHGDEINEHRSPVENLKPCDNHY